MIGGVAGKALAWEEPKRIERHKRENIEWTVAYSYDGVKTNLPRVLLIGDSICNGYQAKVRGELAGKATVSFWASSRCVCDARYLRELEFYLDAEKYDVIHFNNGLHSLHSYLPDWKNSLRAAVRLIKEKANGAKIIWASSTPLKDPKLTERVREQNAIAAQIMKEEGIPTNDLFALMDPLDRGTFWSDTFHYKGPGIDKQAKQVARVVLRLLSISSDPAP